MSDDGSREVHGVALDAGNILITAREHGNQVIVAISHSEVKLTVAKAKHLRRSLSRLIRRIESRETEPVLTATVKETVL